MLNVYTFILEIQNKLAENAKVHVCASEMGLIIHIDYEDQDFHSEIRIPKGKLELYAQYASEDMILRDWIEKAKADHYQHETGASW